MPELTWRWSYPVLLAVMAALEVALYRTFKRRGWL
jgi:magnesium transporter